MISKLWFKLKTFFVESKRVFKITKKPSNETFKTTANREEQVLDFVVNNIKKKGLNVYSAFHPHGMRGYIFIESENKDEAQKSYQGVPYAKGLLRAPVSYQEIEHMLEQAKAQVNIQNKDIVEII